MKSIRWTMAAGVALVAVVALSGCGGGDKPKVASAGGSASAAPTGAAGVPTDPYQRALKYAQCMRQNGVNMKDPPPPKEGGMQAAPGVPMADVKKYEKARPKCKQFEPTAGGTGAQKPLDPQKVLNRNKCLRANGINISDDPKQPIQLDDKNIKVFEKCSKEAGLR